MMFFAHNHRCGGRRNPRLAAILGAFSALMIGAATVIEQHDGAHWPIALAGFLCAALVGLAVLRLIMLNRDGGGR